MKFSNTVTFTAPRQVELRQESLPALGADDVLVETICSAISAGTEMLVYRGQFPREINSVDAISSGLHYPTAYGYACAGHVIEIGSRVDPKWAGRLIFSFQPHVSHFVTTTDCLIPIPENISPETACFLPNMETAVNVVQDAAPILGERVLVLGQGVIGLLTTSLLSEFPLECLIAADCYELRRNALKVEGQKSKVIKLDPGQSDFHGQAKKHLSGGADLTLELSGSPSALDDAITLTRFSGRIVIGSWYGEKCAPIDLGHSFHHSRIKLISSQVSTIAPELSARWDKSRRFDVAWKALERIKPEKWITHRFPIEEASKAYDLVDKNPQETIQIIFNYT
ncbi:MAG: zinc-binding alcohol dehydrogenase [Chloroflexi bacterium]|nr:zinc-binding alcohol dehydrogenase [Chloroflexota bacterium]